jgi:uncharacterized protein (TIRG00374 family)
MGRSNAVKGRWFFWFLAVAFVWFMLARQTEFEQVMQTLRLGRFFYILIAVGLQMAYQGAHTALLYQAFATVNIHSRFREMVLANFGANFVNTLFSFGGAGGVIYLTRYAAGRGQPPVRAAAGAVMVVVADLIAISMISLSGIIYLFLNQGLQTYEIAAAAVLLLMTLLLLGLLLTGWKHPDSMLRFFRLAQRLEQLLLGRFKRQPIFTDRAIEKVSGEFATAAAGIDAQPRRLLILVAIALGVQMMNMLCFYFLFIAFRQPITFGPLVAGYAMGILFMIVFPTPQGIGAVEGIVPLVLSSLGVPANQAVAVVLSYRGLTFWLPLFIGFVVQGYQRSVRL